MNFKFNIYFNKLNTFVIFQKFNILRMKRLDIFIKITN